MQTLDLIIIFGYLIGITIFGIIYAGKQETTEDYFVGDRNVPWWAIAASIVATETSTITFISVPGVAFARNGNFEFLQIVFGYLCGRVVISLLFIPLYFKGELQTVYQLLGDRFGNKVKMLASALVCRDAKYRRRHSPAFDGVCSRGGLCRVSARNVL